MPVPGGVIFCDDVRREASGKDIVVGIYANNIILPQLPVVMGLWTISTITFARDEKASEICLRLVLPDGRELRQAPLALPAFERLPPDSDYRMLKFRSHFQEVEVSSRGRIRLIAEVDGADLRLGGLDVLEMASAAPSATAGGMFQSYLRGVLGNISERPDDQQLNFMSSWVEDFGAAVNPEGEASPWQEGRALILPVQNGVRGVFTRPLVTEEIVSISGLPEGVGATEVQRTPFSVTFELDHLPVPLLDIRIEATGRKQVRPESKHRSPRRRLVLPTKKKKPKT